MEPGAEVPEPAARERLFIGNRLNDGEAGTVYRSRLRSLLSPAEVRWQDFPMTRFGRRGLDPEAVRAFLHRVEADMDALYREIVTAWDEARQHHDAAMELRAERWRPREPGTQRPRAEYRRPPVWPPYSRHQQGCHRRPGDESGDG